MLTFLIALAVALPTGLGLGWFLLWMMHRAYERRAAAFASRVKCPTCGGSSLVWSAEWAIKEEDTDEEVSGYSFLCPACDKEFHFTEKGDLFDHPSFHLEEMNDE